MRTAVYAIVIFGLLSGCGRDGGGPAIPVPDSGVPMTDAGAPESDGGTPETDAASDSSITNPRIAREVSLSGGWTIDGADPSAENCAAAGIARVTFVFILEDGTEDPVIDPIWLMFDCKDGAFNTAPVFVLASGARSFFLRALDPAGETVADGARIDINPRPGDHVSLPTVDF